MLVSALEPNKIFVRNEPGISLLLHGVSVKQFCGENAKIHFSRILAL